MLLVFRAHRDSERESERDCVWMSERGKEKERLVSSRFGPIAR